MGISIALGAGIGSALGVATYNIGMRVAIGVSIGTSLDKISKKEKNDNQE